MNIDPETRREIIIVRRGRNDGEDSHHGGVWKIAYADFMTAMMAFFLVMWLINAANEETKAAVASYFNPVKLMDRQARPKGIEATDNQEGKVRFERPNSTDAETKSARNEKDQQSKPETEERQIFKDPYAVLAEIATDSGVLQNRSAKGEGGSNAAGPSTGAEGGDAYRDPFNPNYWSTHVEDDLFPLTDSPAVPPPSQEQLEKRVAGIEAKTEAQAGPADTKTIDPANAKQQAEQQKVENASTKPVETAVAVTPAKGDQQPDAAQLASARELAAEISQKTGAAADEKTPDITVVPTDDGVMIQLTDKVDYGMFAIGSAKPDKRVVQVLDQIGKIIATRKGEVIISGHTDARPFKSDSYDNWRLSSARAHMAYYMLTRGGLDAKRILRVEGYADRDPKVPADPYAAQNRRIDIFLKTAKR
ncbi:MotB family protein [Phyllobacterium sp. OV277]|uniref:MotB family protein n=1 Tax=Phyllobacterium sp. OV277 TaxID=1882772 RepID=UPI00087E06C0|nr:MotB family protein [Phyllobacterium sp. OV277]SDP79530.1 chemotaxis protein MotB [Phyllobacterium sp. OV277]